MIIEIIFYVFYQILSFLTSFLPADRLASGGFALPFGTDTVLSNAFELTKAFAIVFPPINTVLIAFGIYLGFLIGIRLVRMIPIVGRFID